MTTDELRSWLKGANKNREWLSEKIGAPKRTIDNWFSAGEIPDMAQKLIGRIIAEETTVAPRFSSNDWKMIMEAMKASGYDNYEEFVKNSLIEMAKDPSRISRKND